jgi:hypothetical protein
MRGTSNRPGARGVVRVRGLGFVARFAFGCSRAGRRTGRAGEGATTGGAAATVWTTVGARSAGEGRRGGAGVDGRAGADGAASGCSTEAPGGGSGLLELPA